MTPEIPRFNLNRRTFVRDAMAASAAIALAPVLLGPAPAASALELDATVDTFNGFGAFVLPGNDAYSKAQGVTAPGPGGVATGFAKEVAYTFDHYVSASLAGLPAQSLPLSATIAGWLNYYALQVAPLAALGLFLSPFARLSYKQKAEALRRSENDTVLHAGVNELRFIAGAITALGAALCYSESGAFNPATGSVTSTPIGWQISSWQGPADGHPVMLGYYKGQRQTTGAP